MTYMIVSCMHDLAFCSVKEHQTLGNSDHWISLMNVAADSHV